MQIEKKDNYTSIICDENTFSEFYNSFLIEEKKLQKENLIVIISDKYIPSLKEFSLFLDISEQKKENGTSFVLVNTEIDVDNFPENFNIVPTLQEAVDILEMEAIERELEF
jgi:hypothetical protein